MIVPSVAIFHLGGKAVITILHLLSIHFPLISLHAYVAVHLWLQDCWNAEPYAVVPSILVELECVAHDKGGTARACIQKDCHVTKADNECLSQGETSCSKANIIASLGVSE